MNNRLAMTLFLISASMPISTYSKDFNVVENQAPYVKNINLDVQLKSNGWIKILNEDVYIFTPENYERVFLKNKDESRIAASAKFRREVAKTMGHDENYRILYIKIQFLNYCKASVDKDEVAKYQKEWDDMVDRIPSKVSNKANMPAKEYDLFGMIMANTQRFRCNYRTTLVTSYYSSSGEEIKTEKNIPIAQWETDNKRKEEMLPGETMTIPNIIPDEAKYWYVWVPK